MSESRRRGRSERVALERGLRRHRVAVVVFEAADLFETPPPEVSPEGKITVNPPTGARTLNSRTAIFFAYTGITPAMIMRLTEIGSQYLVNMSDADGNYFDGARTYKVTLPEGIPAAKFWFTILRLYSPLESFFTKTWRPSEIELVQ